MTVDQYIDNINKRYKLGNATEHTFRGDLQTLIESLVTDIRATNEPKRQSCGAPDYILTKKEIPVGFIEAKDIGDKDLDGAKKTGNKEQFELGILKLKPITKELFEVVVKTARAPLTIKGDTIEYNAASFKVPPGSTVEDLLRKLPGVLVDQNGNITAQGKEVKKAAPKAKKAETTEEVVEVEAKTEETGKDFSG